MTKRFESFCPSIVELRTSPDNKDVSEALGMAVVYNSWSQPIYGYFKERFLPGAFTDCLAKNPDIICTRDHNYTYLLGRTSAETLKLTDSAEGLRALNSLPNTGYARDLASLISRKDIRGMSFTFDAVTDVWGKEDGQVVRTVSKANIFEVCFTGNPAYLATTAGVRSLYSEAEIRSYVDERIQAATRTVVPTAPKPDWQEANRAAQLKLLELHQPE